MTQTSHELANFFVEASKALEERPQILAKLSETEESLAICQNTNYGKDEQISRLRAQIDNLQALVFDANNNRDAAEYAAMEAKDMAEKLISSIRDAMKGAAAVDAILNPTPEVSSPTVEPVGEAASSSEQPQSEPASSSAGQSEHTSTEVERPLDALSTTIETSTTAPTASVSSEHPHGTTAGIETNANSGGIYADRFYWDKPDSMTWQTWIAGGGPVAPWYNANEDGDRT